MWRQADAAGAATRSTLVADPSFLQVLEQHHPRAVAVSATEKQGLGNLNDAVIEMVGADFANAAIETEAGNGKVLSYLAAHAREKSRLSATACVYASRNHRLIQSVAPRLRRGGTRPRDAPPRPRLLPT